MTDPDYYVVKLVTDFELLVNMGQEAGISEGSVLEVLDPSTQDVRDPRTGEDLGSLDRPKARIAVVTVGDKISLCRVLGRSPGGVGLSAISRVMSGETPRLIGGSHPSWPEAVEPLDPVRRTGHKLKEVTS